MKMLKLTSAKASFLYMVLLPTFLALIYNFFIATPFYHSEAKIMVKSLGTEEAIGGIAKALRSIGVLEPSGIGSYVVMDHVLSRDFMNSLDAKFKIKEHYSGKNIDFLQRFDPLVLDPSYENFYKDYYLKEKIVSVSINPNSSIITIRYRSPDPRYAKALSEESVRMVETFVNSLNLRASETKLKYFVERLEENKKRIRELTEKVKKFIVTTKVLSPEQQAAVVLQTTAKLQEQLLLRQIELARIQAIAPESSRIQELKREIDQLKREIDKNLSSLTGSQSALGPSAVELEVLKMEFGLLQKELEVNTAAYLQAVNQLRLQQFYVELVEKPRVADAPIEPERFKNILTVFAIAFAIWGVVSILYTGVKEHSGR